MDFESNPQEECVAEVDDSKKPLPSNKVRIKLLRNDVVSAYLSSGGALAEGPPAAAEHHRGETTLGRNHSRPDGSGKRYVLSDPMKEGKPTCILCNKSFLSEKSLYGHMRCHPERGYRGMQPPKKTGSGCSEIADVADGGPALDLPPRWPVKDRRGRKNKKKCIRVHDDDEDEEKLYDAAQGLLMLPDQSNKINQIDDQDSRITSKRYKCTICDKSFASAQALGGHRASGHKKKKEERVNEDVVESQSEKAFPSGQALAGHKRCHWQGPSSSSSSTSPAGQQLMSKKVSLDFDLNQLPEDDDHHHHGDRSKCNETVIMCLV